MPRIVSVPLSLEQRERLIFLAKHAKHWRERQRAQTILWLSEGKSVAEVATLQERISETIRLQRRRWKLYKFGSIKESHRSGRPDTLISDYQAKILDWRHRSFISPAFIIKPNLFVERTVCKHRLFFRAPMDRPVMMKASDISLAHDCHNSPVPIDRSWA